MLLPLPLLLLSALASAVEVKRPRGVSLTNHHFYEESKPFTCLDGSSTIAFDWVNDDYCDCQDGSDEPGTSACPNGRFHCTNAGYRPLYIPSSRVNDGVCDCCDATDEYNSGFVCENTCKEMGRKEREALAQLAEVAREGFQLKQALIEEARKGREEKQRSLAELQEGKKSLEEQVETLRSAKEAAEKPEQEAKEIHRKNWEEQKAAERAAQEQARASEAFLELDDDGDGLVSVAELQTHPELDVDGDGTLSETEAQTLLGNALQADASSFQDAVWAAVKENYKPEGLPDATPLPEAPVEEAPEPQPDLPPEQPAPEDDYEEEEEEEEEEEGGDEEEPKVPPPKQPSDKAAEEDGEEKMPPYDDATQSLIDALRLRGRSRQAEAGAKADGAHLQRGAGRPPRVWLSGRGGARMAVCVKGGHQPSPVQLAPAPLQPEAEQCWYPHCLGGETKAQALAHHHRGSLWLYPRLGIPAR
ncbi:glucosidase 2 subunit beta isoform X2 [Carettochelys insculpta]|uniref:glucosidase 2 subunit beta isoform X2 n=1 Tax=Carettochelys insculpta TaxID=44489 RepID=UPI003EBFE5BC